MNPIPIYFFKGIIIGLAFGIPVGTIGALTIKRTLSHGWAAGLSSGIGCSSADLLYASISIFGVSIISDYLLRYQTAISILGGIFVIIMGVHSIMKGQIITNETAKSSKLLSFFASSFIIATTNPTTILTFVLAFSIFRVGEVDSFLGGINLAVGIFVGTSIWWILIALGFHSLKSRLTKMSLATINTALGCFIVLFGVTVIVGTLF